MPRSRFQLAPGGLLYLVVALLVWGAARYTQANLLFWALGLLVGGLLASLLVGFFMLRRVEVQRLLPAHGVVGEPLVITYRLTSHQRRFPIFNLLIEEAWGTGRSGRRVRGRRASVPAPLAGAPQAWALHLGPGDTVQAQAPCFPQRRGVIAFERVVLSSSFPFGVFRRVLDFPQPAELVIYPHLYRIQRVTWQTLAAADPAGHHHRGLIGGAEEFHGLRRYRTGDSTRLIDWKHSAKTGLLICREMTQPSPPRIMLLLDLSSAPPRTAVPGSPSSHHHITTSPHHHIAPDPRIERAISLAASLIVAAHLEGYQVGLAVAGARCPAFRIHHSLAHRTRLLAALTRLEVQPGSGGLPALPSDPSVIVRVGLSGASALRGRRLILGEAQMEEFVTEYQGGTSAILAQQSLPQWRRPRRE